MSWGIEAIRRVKRLRRILGCPGKYGLEYGFLRSRKWRQATTSSLEIPGSGQITHSSKPSFSPVPSPVLVYPDGRRQKPSVPTRKSAQGSGWTCLPEVRDPVSKPSVHVEERHRQPSVSSPKSGVSSYSACEHSSLKK